MKKILTQIIIILTALIWIAYDIFAYFHWGNPATESAVLVRWSTHAPGVSFLIGVLCGHLFFQMSDPVEFK